MKRFSMLICTVLVLISVFFLPVTDFMRTDIRAGKGSGVSKEITSAQDFGELLLFLGNSESSDKLSENVDPANGIIFLSAEKSGEDSETEATSEAKKDSRYTGVTLYEDAVLRSSYSSTSGTAYGTEMERELKIYLTTDASYYISSGKMDYHSKIYQKESGETKKQQYRLSWNFEVYISEEYALLKINEWTGIGDLEFDFSKDVFGKWFELPEEGAFSGFAVDLMNREIFADMGEYISENEAMHFEKNGSVYTVKDAYLRSCFNSMIGLGIPKDAEMEGYFSVDFGDKKSPSVEYGIDMTNTSYFSYEDVNRQITSTAFATSNMTFENINNTEIQLGDHIEISEEDLNDYLIYVEEE